MIMIDTIQRRSYESITREAVSSLEQIGIHSADARALVKQSFDIFYTGAPISNRLIGEYKTLETRTILQTMVRPHALHVRNSNWRRIDLQELKSKRSLTLEEAEEYSQVSDIVKEYVQGKKILKVQVDEGLYTRLRDAIFGF